MPLQCAHFVCINYVRIIISVEARPFSQHRAMTSYIILILRISSHPLSMIQISASLGSTVRPSTVLADVIPIVKHSFVVSVNESVLI